MSRLLCFCMVIGLLMVSTALGQPKPLIKGSEAAVIDNQRACNAAGGRWFSTDEAQGCRVGQKAQGLWRTYVKTDAGQWVLRLQVEYKDNVAHGPYREYYPR